MFVNFHVSGMMFSAMLYMLVRYASPKVPLCFRCLMFNFSGHVQLLFCSDLLPLGPELLRV